MRRNADESTLNCECAHNLLTWQTLYVCPTLRLIPSVRIEIYFKNKEL
jgi:hypothetical protein